MTLSDEPQYDTALIVTSTLVYGVWSSRTTDVMAVWRVNMVRREGKHERGKGSCSEAQAVHH